MNQTRIPATPVRRLFAVFAVALVAPVLTPVAPTGLADICVGVVQFCVSDLGVPGGGDDPCSGIAHTIMADCDGSGGDPGPGVCTITPQPPPGICGAPLPGPCPDLTNCQDVCGGLGERVYGGGHGDTIVIWTPLMVVNSPYLGSATRTAETSITTTFNFGWPAVIELQDTESHTIAASASGGDSLAWYMLLKWRHVQYWEVYGCGQFNDEDYWYVYNYAPTGNRVLRSAWLTGASQQTDADNLFEPAWTGWEANWPSMTLDFRYGENGENYDICTQPGQEPTPITVSSSRIYENVLVSFAYNDVTVVGVTTTEAQSNSYSYSLPGGHCWRIHHPSGPGRSAAFHYDGLNQAGTIPHLEWHGGRTVGCDALDLVEKFLGPADLGDYAVHMISDGAERGELKVEPRGSEATLVVEAPGFDRAWVDDAGRFAMADFARSGSNLHVDGTLVTRVDYEWAEPIPFPFNLHYWTPGGTYEMALLGVMKAGQLHVQVTASTLPLERLKGLEAVVDDAAISNAAGNLMVALAQALLQDPSEGYLTTDIVCNLHGIASPLNEYQNWLATGSISTTGIVVATLAEPFSVRVDLSLM